MSFDDIDFLEGFQYAFSLKSFLDSSLLNNDRIIDMLTTEQVVDDAIHGIRLDKDMVMIPSIFYLLMVIKAMVSIEADGVFSDKVLRFARSMKTFSGRGGPIQDKASKLNSRDDNHHVENHDVNANESSIVSTETNDVVTDDDTSGKKSS